ncbi:MAG TPA: hypothetical protein VND64_36950 [Pirellulales bacterium]|nr:hypothetical protein [Pirellulales bacterium]
MRFLSQTFWLAKDADSPDQYQDAFELDAERGLAAIADGVSSAIFSGPWARVLTRATIDDPPRFDVPGEFQDWLARRRAAWAGGIDTAKLTWYQRPKMVDGAMTTLLWCELWPDEKGDDGLAKNYQLYSFAIGDSCLFHVREGKWLAWYPLTGSAEFGLNPAVVQSIDRKRDHLLEFRRYDERCLPGDLLVLATDAIALWAVECQEAGDPIEWERYWGMSDEAWRDEIFALRSATRMRFDDSTLVLLRVIEETPAPPPPAEESPPAEGSPPIDDDSLVVPTEEPTPEGEELLTLSVGRAMENDDVLVLPEDALVSADGEPAPTIDLDSKVVDLASATRDVVASPYEPRSSVTDEFAERDEGRRMKDEG